MKNCSTVAEVISQIEWEGAISGAGQNTNWHLPNAICILLQGKRKVTWQAPWWMSTIWGKCGGWVGGMPGMWCPGAWRGMPAMPAMPPHLDWQGHPRPTDHHQPDRVFCTMVIREVSTLYPQLGPSIKWFGSAWLWRALLQGAQLLASYHRRNLKPITARPAGPPTAADGWRRIQTVRYNPKIDTIRSPIKRSQN